MDILSKAVALANECSEVILVSVGEDGRPRPCVLSKIRNDGIRTFHVATGLSGVKSQHFLKSAVAGACYWRGQDSVTLTGDAVVYSDADTRREAWQDWFIHHFPGGVDDPNYCVIEFTAREATIWIDSEFVTLPIE